MAERERRNPRRRSTVFVPKTQLLSADDVERAMKRMAHEIIERTDSLENLVVIGLQDRKSTRLNSSHT